MKDKSMEIFESMPVAQAVFKNALPAMAAMLMVLVYNLADTFFIGQTHDALQVAAVSLATPVFLLFMAAGTIFGIGGTSVISRALGEGRKDHARKVCSFCMWSCVVLGVAMSAVFLIFMDPILTLIGASAETWEMTKTYLWIVAWSGPFVLVSNCYANVIRAEGESGKAMMGQLLGNLINVVLDPIMILGFGWNVAGAAIATVIGNVIGAAYYIFYFLSGKSSLSIHPREFTVKEKVCSSVQIIGIPAALGSLLMSVSQILINSHMAQYGDMAVAAMGVAMKVITITGMICMGLGQGIQPLLHFVSPVFRTGADRYLLRFFRPDCQCVPDRSDSLYVCGSFCSHPVNHKLSVRRLLRSYQRAEGMGAAAASFVINVSRQGLIFIPAMYLLEAAMGISGLVWAQPAADVLSFGLALILYVHTWRKLSQSKTETTAPAAAAEKMSAVCE